MCSVCVTRLHKEPDTWWRRTNHWTKLPVLVSVFNQQEWWTSKMIQLIADLMRSPQRFGSPNLVLKGVFPSVRWRIQGRRSLCGWNLVINDGILGTLSNGGFLKWGYPQSSSHFNRIFHYKPSSYWGIPMTMETSKWVSRCLQIS